MSSLRLFSTMLHLGYVVTDLERVKARMRVDHGINEWLEVPLAPDSSATRIALAGVGETTLELVEVDPAGDLLPIHADWLPAAPEAARFNHVAYLLDTKADWQAAQELFRQRGVAIPLAMPFGEAFEFFYADTVPDLGHWSEFICLGPAGREFLAQIPRF